jgi:hypothetical protein
VADDVWPEEIANGQGDQALEPLGKSLIPGHWHERFVIPALPVHGRRIDPLIVRLDWHPVEGRLDGATC